MLLPSIIVALSISRKRFAAYSVLHYSSNSETTNPDNIGIRETDCRRPDYTLKSFLQLTEEAKTAIDKALKEHSQNAYAFDALLIIGPDDMKWLVADYLSERDLFVPIEVLEMEHPSEKEIFAILDARFQRCELEAVGEGLDSQANPLRTSASKKARTSAGIKKNQNDGTAIRNRR